MNSTKLWCNCPLHPPGKPKLVGRTTYYRHKNQERVFQLDARSEVVEEDLAENESELEEELEDDMGEEEPKEEENLELNESEEEDDIYVDVSRSEEHTSELQSLTNLVC